MVLKKDLKKLNILELSYKLKDMIIKTEALSNSISNVNTIDNNEEETDELSLNNYENMLVKLEADVRSHIKTEFQLKIYCDSLESKIESLEKQLTEQEKINKTLNKFKELSIDNSNKISDLEKVAKLIIFNYLFTKN